MKRRVANKVYRNITRRHGGYRYSTLVAAWKRRNSGVQSLTSMVVRGQVYRGPPGS